MSSTGYLAHNYQFSGPDRDVPVIIRDGAGGYPSPAQRYAEWHPATDAELARYEAFWDAMDDEQMEAYTARAATLLPVGTIVGTHDRRRVVIRRVVLTDVKRPYRLDADRGEPVLRPEDIREVLPVRVIFPETAEFRAIRDTALRGARSVGLSDGSTATYFNGFPGESGYLIHDHIIVIPRSDHR